MGAIRKNNSHKIFEWIMEQDGKPFTTTQVVKGTGVKAASVSSYLRRMIEVHDCFTRLGRGIYQWNTTASAYTAAHIKEYREETEPASENTPEPATANYEGQIRPGNTVIFDILFQDPAEKGKFLVKDEANELHVLTPFSL
jgi:hypothetical protein